MNLAFLGTGLMGTGFVRRMLANGHTVSVWNRDPAKAKALEAHGAKAFADAAGAARGAQRIHLSLSDDASVDAVLEPLAAAIPASTWIVDHTTTAVTPTAARSARWAGRGRVYLHAPVFMAPVNCHEGTGLMLISGEKSRCDAIAADLQQMTGKVWWLGEAPERAAAFKLFGNLTLIGMNGVLGDVARLAHAVGIAPAEAMGLFERFNPGAMLQGRAAKIASGPYSPPSFEVSMARKDVRLMIEEAAAHGVDLAVMPAVAALFDAAIARGAGAMDASAAMAYPPPKG
ncbi:MAG TPA: NAD(P)-binding domain-containing protein [Quisquiliibacterium sp.]|nr:NAD(P)-binding domain-containing protein [Quisquiliibacterium sp.]